MGRWMLGSWLLVISLVIPIAAQEPANELKTKISNAIKDLGANSFSVRHAAQAELLKLGPEAETALRATVNSSDMELADRAQVILGEFARRRLDSKLDKVNWKTILEHVKHHAASDDWQKPGFSDSIIEKAVEKVIAQANQAAEVERVQMPVRFGGLSPITEKDQEVRQGKNRIFCGRGSFNFDRSEESILLVDGSVNVGYATRCLIIARGAVTISHGAGNVVLAGHFIDISHDGSGIFDPRRAGPAMGGGSLVMSGSILRISHAARAICSAPDELSVGSTECVFLNSVPPSEPDRANSRRIDNISLQLQPKGAPNPILNQLKITQAIEPGDSGTGYAIAEHNGVEVVLRPDAEIKDNLGKPVPNLAGWKLSFVADHYAILSNGREDAGFVIPKAR